jgi:hypothetical protein
VSLTFDPSFVNIVSRPPRGRREKKTEQTYTHDKDIKSSGICKPKERFFVEKKFFSAGRAKKAKNRAGPPFPTGEKRGILIY